MAIHIVIPSRWGSTRFPGKALHQINGKPLIQHTADAARIARRDSAHSPSIESIRVATDDDRIAVASGMSSVMTQYGLRNGTERCWDAATRMEWDGEDWVINWQGDAPLIPVEVLDAVIWGIKTTGLSDDRVITPVYPTFTPRGSVTVAMGQGGNHAMYFSRQPLPSPLDFQMAHIGMYAFRVRSLNKYQAYGPGHAERAEDLEQLRWLEIGVPIRTVMVPSIRQPLVELNTPEDAELLKGLLP